VSSGSLTLQSRLYGRILRQAPAALEATVGRLVRGGYLRIIGGAPAWLPLGVRVLDRILKETHTAWREAQVVELGEGRLGSGWVDLIQPDLQSYRQLPIALRRVRSLAPGSDAGAIFPRRAVEWAAARAEAADEWSGGLDESISSLLRRLGLTSVRAARGEQAWSWVVRGDRGPTRVLGCPACGNTAVAEFAAFRRLPMLDEALVESAIVATPHADTIARLTSGLEIDPRKTLKAMFFELADSQILLAVIRGDLEVEVAKIEAIAGQTIMGPAREAAIRRTGAIPGYASPIGLPVRTSPSASGLWVLADISVEGMANFVAGANRDGFHITGVNFPRDFRATEVADIAKATEGFACGACGGALAAWTGVEVARMSASRDCFRFTGRDGAEALGSMIWGAVLPESILMAASAAMKDALEWPRRIAPFDAHILNLVNAPEAQGLAAELVESGLDVLLDDRSLSAGVRLAEADWIGAACRVVVGRRSTEQGGVEIRGAGADPAIIGWDKAREAVLALLV
jgi:prolyl-tRNA synthetase